MTGWILSCLPAYSCASTRGGGVMNLRHCMMPSIQPFNSKIVMKLLRAVNLISFYTTRVGLRSHEAALTKSFGSRSDDLFPPAPLSTYTHTTSPHSVCIPSVATMHAVTTTPLLDLQDSFGELGCRGAAQHKGAIQRGRGGGAPSADPCPPRHSGHGGGRANIW